MLKTKLSNKKTNYFLGGYILDLKPFPDRSYISIAMKSYNEKNPDGETVFIMIYKKSGFGDKKYDNPSVKVAMDAFAQNIPIACCYYDDIESNKMVCCYANFTADKNKRPQDETPPVLADSLKLDDSEELPL